MLGQESQLQFSNILCDFSPSSILKCMHHLVCDIQIV